MGDRILVLVRHGESEWNKKNLFTGWRDVDLTENGIEEARTAGRRIKAQGLRFDVGFTSALIRAQHSLDLVLEEIGQRNLPVFKDQALNERDYGDLSGLNKDDARAKWGAEQVHVWRRSYDVAPPGGESLANAGKRVLATLDRLLAANQRKTLLLVSHVTPIKTVACRALLAPPAALFRIHLDVASLTEIDWFADGPVLLRSLNDTSHLR